MPPANSPAEVGSPTDSSRPEARPDTPASFRSALRELASPVPDYASTLTIQAEEDDVDAQNINFLRAHLASPEEERLPEPALPRSERESTSAHYLRLRDRANRNATGEVPVRHEDTRSSLSDVERERERTQLLLAYQHHHLIQQRQNRQTAQIAPYGNRRMQSALHEDTPGPAVETLGRYDPSDDRMTEQGVAPYGDRIPNQQSLYDWAPATEEGEEEELETVLAELRRQQPNTHPEILRVLARADLEEIRNPRFRGAIGSTRTTSNGQQEPSLRSAAILQSVRRNWRFSTRSRMLMSRYVMERERAARETESGHVQSSAHTAAETVRSQSDRNLDDLELTERDFRDSVTATDPRLERIDMLRRRYLENPSNKPSEFDRIIQYLHLHAQRNRDGSKGRSSDVSSGSSFVGPANEQQQDSRRYCIQARPSPSSWLTAGASFTGHQHATPLVRTQYRLSNGRSNTSTAVDEPASETPNLSQPWLAQHLTSTPLSLHSTPVAPGTPNPGPLPDRWTVKVAIHAVDYYTMTLQGTMEAYNVPSVTTYSSQHANTTSSNQSQHDSSRQNSNQTNSLPPGESPDSSSSTNKTTFSTYLEGEIIDFSNHTLLTELDNFAVKTSSTVDALYWRRLEPFAKLGDSEIARALSDPTWVEEQLMGRYILMRWKERCFVKPTFTSFSNATPSSLVSGTPVHSAASGATAPQRQRRSRDSSGPNTSGQGNSGTLESTFRPIPPPTDQSAATSFLSGADGNGYGLSISGYYYVSLRRSDGHCEGLYYDPKSSPYQHLELKPTQATWGCGSWEFR